MTKIVLEVLTTAQNFEEAAYLASNPDVARAVAQGHFPSGRAHFDIYGHAEGRRMRTSALLDEAQSLKLRRLDDGLRKELPHRVAGQKHDFLTPQLRDDMGIMDTDNVSSHDYPADMQAIVDSHPDGLILDFGSGKRATYFSNVVNYDVVNYATTDVIGVGEVLPFKDNLFDAVISNAVLEHVKQPASCAQEIARVLKPGGTLWCSVAFLSPVHGYPNHYFNMTAQGLRSLFEPYLEIDAQTVPDVMRPIYGLRWIVHLWAAGLTGETRERFLDMSLKDLLKPMPEIENADWIRGLSDDKNFELATCTAILAHKPAAR